MCVLTSGTCGYTKTLDFVSLLKGKFREYMPIACPTIFAPKLTLSPRLNSGNGTRAVDNPRMTVGSNSKCVCSLVRSSGFKAMYVFSSSSASKYSMIPSFIKSDQLIFLFFIFSRCFFVNFGLPFSTRIRGLLALPESVNILTTSKCFK